MNSAIFSLFQCLIHDGSFDWVVILHDTIILIWLHVRAVEKMFYSLVRVFVISILNTAFTLFVADLIMSPAHLTGLSCSLTPLVIHKALQIRL